jgi:hypothetical protein
VYTVLLFCFGVASVDIQRGYSCMYLSVALSPSPAQFLGMSWLYFKAFLLSIIYTPSILPSLLANHRYLLMCSHVSDDLLPLLF